MEEAAAGTSLTGTPAGFGCGLTVGDGPPDGSPGILRARGAKHLHGVKWVDRWVGVSMSFVIILERNIVGNWRKVLLQHADVPLDDGSRFPFLLSSSSR